MELLKKSKWIYIALSLVYIALGVVLFAYPAETVNVICRIVGVTAVILGIYNILKCVLKYGTSFSMVLNFITGVFSFVCGIILLINPDFVKTFFPVIIGIIVIIDSAFKLLTSFELKNERTKAWWSVFFLSVAGIILGFIVVFNASKTVDLVIRLIGVALIIDGIENLAAVFFTSKVVKKAIKNENPLEADFREIKTEPESTDEPTEENK